MAYSKEPFCDLYMAKSMEELNKKTSAKNIECSTPKLLGRSSNALFLAAKDAALQKDEEKAYVLFMRFMELVKRIRSSKEYKSRKAEYDKLIPGHKIKTALGEAERLSESLRVRYTAPQGKRQKLDGQGEGVTDQQVPSDTNEAGDKPKSAEEVYRQSNGNALVPQQQAPPTSSDVIEDGFMTDSQSSNSLTVTAQDLFSLLKSSPDDVIVLDCRPRSMFLASHPDGKKFPQWLSVPEELIKKGVTCESIEKYLRGKGRKMWAERVAKVAIVLVDVATTSSDLADSDGSGLPLLQLRDAIHKFDTSVELPRPPLCLEGGYSKWYLHYSPLCVGVWRWEGGGGGKGEGGGEGETGKSLDYPTFPEITEYVAEGETEDSPSVAMEEAIPDPSNDHTPQAPPTQIVPSAPVAPHTVTNHTPLPHPPAPSVPMPVYQPPPVMTILSLDDPNLNGDDPSVQLSTMPEIRVNQFGNVHSTSVDPQMQHQGVAQPVLQPVHPVSQSGVNQFVLGQGAQVNPQHPHMGQQFGANLQMGQAPAPVHQQSGQPHPQIAQSAPHFEQNYPQMGQHGQFDPQTGLSQFVNPATEQVMHPANPPMGHSYHQNVHWFAHGQSHPPMGQQPLPPIGQAPLETGQPNLEPALQHGPHQALAPQTGQSHPQIVQSTPQISLHNPPIGQTIPDGVSNPRVAYGPIPNPPGYDQALNLPSQAPPTQPLPPPFSLPHPQTNQFDQISNPAGLAPHIVGHYQMGQPQWDHTSQPVQNVEGQVGLVQNRFQDQVQPAALPPRNTATHPATDASAEKIRELERQLQMKEERERERRETEEREKEAILREKQKWEQEKQQEREELEREKVQLAQQQAALVKNREDLERMRVQVEEERKESLKESEQLKQMLQIQQSGQRDQRAFTVNQGLPAGWEKRLDRTTGRFYYVDHKSRTTHWNPPANWLDYQAQLQQQRGTAGQIPGRGPQPDGVPGQISQFPPAAPQPQVNAAAGRVGRHDNLQPRAGLPHPVSTQPPVSPQQPQQQPIRNMTTPTPPVVDAGHPAHPQAGQPVAKPAVPSVDRSSKPQAPAAQPSIDRSTKPTMTPAVYRRKVNALQPMHGSSQGYGLTGLRNLGNTCFMNSTLQCLCATTPFVSYFLRGQYLKDRNRANPLGHGGVLADEFSFLMKSMWSGQYRFISPRDLKEVISQFAPTFSGTQQHDSQEFLAFLLDGLHEDMNRVVERRYIQNPDYSLYDDRKAAGIAWSLHKKRSDSIIVDLFQGQFRSTLHCLTCRHRSVNFEAFMYLSLPLPHGNNPCTLKDCIKLFTKEERVSGNDKWYCSSCKQHRDASKRIEIWKLPAILLIHLKRFSYDGVWRQKKQNFVDFPFTGLNMSADVVGETDGLQEYCLFGVSNHFGTLSGGHYTASCLNPSKQQFYNFDDHEIKAISQRQVKSSAAYLLFYTSMELSAPKVF